VTGAQLLIRCLEQEGVRYVFGVPGEETLDLNDALLDSPIRFVPVRHEQAAAFMADVWGRLTGRAGVCLATLGPGATNLTTGLADANLDRAPVVAITGQLARGLLHKESHQYVDIVEAFRPFTKWNTQIETGEVIPGLATWSCRRTWPRGPPRASPSASISRAARLPTDRPSRAPRTS
jgi:acetolactate synthase I/II/III large subunit